jgi:hypothetical protein
VTLQGDDVCHAGTHGAHHLTQLSRTCDGGGHVQHIVEYLDVELVSSAVEVVLEKLSPNSSFFSNVRVPVTSPEHSHYQSWHLESECLLHLTITWMKSCKRILSLTYHRIPPAKRILKISRITKV